MKVASALLSLAACVTLSAFTPMGGWATISMDPYETRVAINQPLPLAFLIKQHGVKPMVGLKPIVQAVAGNDTLTVDAKPEKVDGRYNAVIRFPHSADWTVTVNSGFRESKTVISPIHVMDASEAALARRSAP